MQSSRSVNPGSGMVMRRKGCLSPIQTPRPPDLDLARVFRKRSLTLRVFEGLLAVDVGPPTAFLSNQAPWQGIRPSGSGFHAKRFAPARPTHHVPRRRSHPDPRLSLGRELCPQMLDYLRHASLFTLPVLGSTVARPAHFQCWETA